MYRGLYLCGPVLPAPRRRGRAPALLGLGDFPRRGRALLPDRTARLSPAQKSETVAAETSKPWPSRLLVQRTLVARTVQVYLPIVTLDPGPKAGAVGSSTVSPAQT